MTLLVSLNEDQKLNALEAINYNKQKITDDLEELRSWLKLQIHLPPSALKDIFSENDNFLEMFLVGNKGNLEKAKTKIDSYYSCRNKSEIFADRDPLSLENKTANESYYAILPRCTKEGYRVVIASKNNLDSTKFNLVAHIRKLVTLFDQQLRMEVNYNGYYFILDGVNFTVGCLLKFRPRIIRECIHLAQDILPIRIKGIFFINAPYILEKAVNTLILPFMSKKLKERVHILSGGNEELETFVDTRILPKNYGGEEPTLMELSKMWTDKELSERDWFINELSEIVDETKRNVNSELNDNSGISNSLKNFLFNFMPDWRRKK